jgi:hypothetical protein
MKKPPSASSVILIQALIPSEAKRLHLYEARFLALLDEVIVYVSTSFFFSYFVLLKKSCILCSTREHRDITVF